MIRETLHLFFPRLCPACGNALLRKETLICFACHYRMPRTNYHLQEDNPIARIFWGRVPLTGAAAYYFFRKEGRVQRLLHELKYKGKPEIGREIGRLYGKELLNSDTFSSSELIIPVPLHPAKKVIRGYNQSDVFGEGLAEAMPGELITDILVRRYNSETQTRKSRFDRWENVETVFGIASPDAIRGKRILLVDDVVTTGATLESCAQHLLKAGAISLSIACIAAPSR